MKEIVLGVGSNIGDRLAHLRHAIFLIKNIENCHIKKVSPIYQSNALLPKEAPESWNLPYLNLAVLCETTLTPDSLLKKIKNIEFQLGRKKNKKWSPRVIDIDILNFDNQIIQTPTLNIPHAELLNRPFALWPLADVLPDWIHPIELKNTTMLTEKWGSRSSSLSPFQTKQLNHLIQAPRLMGIVNITPDSFSDGKKFQSIEKSIHHAKQLVLDGAEILDLGAEATHPTASPVSAQLEWERLEPILSTLRDKKNFILPPIISIDTRHPETAKKALQLGADWINDVSGLDHIKMRKLIAEFNCPIIMMHHLGIPARRHICLPDSSNPIEEILKWAASRLKELTQTGISHKQIILDPGIGFGKNAKQSLSILQNISQLKKLNLPILVGHSRKRFLECFTSHPPENRDEITADISTQFLSQVDFLRVHNVRMHVEKFKIYLNT